MSTTSGPNSETQRTNIPDIIAQGGSQSSIICSLQVDDIGREAVNRDELMYVYRDKVKIAPLSMVDDVLGIAKCGADSVILNSFINSKFEAKKLTLNETKCHKIHVGNIEVVCPKLHAHSSNINEVISDKYIGDIIAADGKNDKNISNRVAKGHGKIAVIMNILREVSLCQYYFQTSVLLRDTVFMSALLLSSEAWVRVTKKNLSDLESVDSMLLKRILDTSSKSSICSLYLELGIYPLRFKIMARRIMFLHYIINCDPKEMLSKVFWVQENDPLEHDWSLSAKSDLR